MPKSIRAVLEKLVNIPIEYVNYKTNGDPKQGTTCILCGFPLSKRDRKEMIDVALKDLSSIVLDALPSVSKELKLDAREKFIWLTAVKECRKEISNIILGGKHE